MSEPIKPLTETSGACTKCGGTGKYTGFGGGECYACRGTGKMVFCHDNIVEFDGRKYIIGDTISFTNTHGVTEPGEIINFFHRKGITLNGWLLLNEVWCTLKNRRTGNANIRSYFWPNEINSQKEVK